MIEPEHVAGIEESGDLPPAVMGFLERHHGALGDDEIVRRGIALVEQPAAGIDPAADDEIVEAGDALFAQGAAYGGRPGLTNQAGQIARNDPAAQRRSVDCGNVGLVHCCARTLPQQTVSCPPACRSLRSAAMQVN